MNDKNLGIKIWASKSPGSDMAADAAGSTEFSGNRAGRDWLVVPRSKRAASALTTSAGRYGATEAGNAAAAG
jgi:hypothetical protein